MKLPSDIKDKDELGRAIFSRKQAKSPIRHAVFLERENQSLSVDRFGFCEIKILFDIQNKNAKLRSKPKNKRSFYGYAKVQAFIARKNGRTVKPTATSDNPYHADIFLPEDIDRDEQKMHAKELASNSYWQAIT